MVDKRTNDDILILDNELIFKMEPGGENAIERETDALLLTNALSPEPALKKINVGPRVSRFELREVQADGDRALVMAHDASRNPMQPPIGGKDSDSEPSPAPFLATRINENALNLCASDKAVKQRSGDSEQMDVTQLLAEARAFASDYGAMQARTRKALYAALGRTYDLSFYADSQPETYSQLIEKAGLTIQDRAPYTPLIKLVFGADYDKTRVAEFAAAIVYGRRKKLSAGSFPDFLNAFDGGLKAVVRLQRAMRNGEGLAKGCSARDEARPAITRKLRMLSLQNWDDLSSEGDEFVLLVARRLPNGINAVVGVVPRDITLLEKAARKLLANLGRAKEVQTAQQWNYTKAV